MPSLFQIGSLVATPGAIALLARQDTHPWDMLARHAAGDFGDLDDADRASNGEEIAAYTSQRIPGRVLSAYQLGEDRLWIITNLVAEGANDTCILLPSEY